MKNKGLNDGNAKKDDEFYTRIRDISAEIKDHKDYLKCFRGKSVLCNCNDLDSSFFKFFFLNFREMGLKELKAIGYSADGNKACMRIYDGGNAYEIQLNGNGDFRSYECQEYMDQADIICTNPPFSLFREYLLMLADSGKQFAIIGNINACTTAKIFPLFQNGKVDFGHTTVKTFDTLDGEQKSFGNIGWYTNIKLKKKLRELPKDKSFLWNEKLYPKYDNYDAIDVSEVRNIPYDYDGQMGVPITILYSYDLSKYEIVGSCLRLAGPIKAPDGRMKSAGGRFYINGKRVYDRIVIQKR